MPMNKVFEKRLNSIVDLFSYEVGLEQLEEEDTHRRINSLKALCKEYPNDFALIVHSSSRHLLRLQKAPAPAPDDYDEPVIRAAAKSFAVSVITAAHEAVKELSSAPTYDYSVLKRATDRAWKVVARTQLTVVV